MMSASQKSRVNSGIARAWNLMAGDAVTAVMKPSDLVINGAFDSGVSGWTSEGWSYSATNHNVVHDTAAPGNTAALSQDISIVANGTYELSFTVSGMSAGSLTSRLGDTPSITVIVNGVVNQQIVTTNDNGLSFTPTIDFNGALDAISCVLVQKPLVTVAYDYPSGNKFSEGLAVDNSGLTLHETRELTFLTSYLDAQLVDVHEVDYWLVNGERWDFLKDAPIQTALVPIAGIHNIVVLSICKAAEVAQAATVSGDFTFE